MTRGCTEAWEANPERAHWLDLSKLPYGAVVEFVDPWDIFPETIVKIGTVATVHEQGLNEMQPALILRPTVPIPELAGYDGLIWLYPPEEFANGRFAEADEFAPSPVKIVEARVA